MLEYRLNVDELNGKQLNLYKRYLYWKGDEAKLESLADQEGRYSRPRVSHENDLIAHILGKLNIKYEMEKKHKTFLIDIYLPELNVAIEINGMNHFIPSSKQFNALTRFKNDILGKDMRVIHFNSYYLNGKKLDLKGLEESIKDRLDRIERNQ